MAEGNDEPKQRWWVYIDLTVVFVVGAVLLGAILTYVHFRSERQSELDAMDRDRARSEAREKELAARAEALAMQRQADLEAKARAKIALAAADAERRERERAQRTAAVEELARKAQQRLDDEKRELAKRKEEASKKAEEEKTKTTEEKTKTTEEKTKAGEEKTRAEDEQKAEEAKANAGAKVQADREREVPRLREILAAATKDIPDLNARIEVLQAKVIVHRRRMVSTATKEDVPESHLVDQAALEERPPEGETVPKPNDGMGDKVEQALQKLAKLRPGRHGEYAGHVLEYLTTLKERNSTIRLLNAATKRRDDALAKLKELGADAVVAPPKPAVPAVVVPKKTFVLKDGKKIAALTAVDGGDVWSIKTETGKIVTIRKDTVEKIEEEAQ